MTSDLLESELRLWDRQSQLQNRKILLFVDSCPAHPELDNLQNIKLVFLPANTMSVLQPMDQGVIRSLKCHFHKLILLRMIECIDKKQEHTVTLLHAIWCVDKLGGVSLRKPSEIAFVTQELQQGDKKSPKPQRMGATKKTMLLLLLLLLMMMMMMTTTTTMTCLSLKGCTKLIVTFLHRTI
jgi:hypothetical protein